MSAVVVLVDMQTRFVNGLTEYHRKRLLKAHLRIIRHCADHDVPLLVLELKRRRFLLTIPELRKEINRVRRVAVFEKEYDDGFLQPVFKETLALLRPRSVILMGVNASWCI